MYFGSELTLPFCANYYWNVPGRKVNENYTETMLSNGGTYAPYIVISSSLKYKLNKRVHSVSTASLSSIWGWQCWVKEMQYRIQHTEVGTTFSCDLYRSSFCLSLSSFTKLTYPQKHTCYMNNFKTALLVCRGHTVTFIIIKVLIVTSYLLLHLLPLCYQWWDTLLL